MTPPLPMRIRNAEVRMAGTTVTVSAHGISMPAQLTEALAKAMWEKLGAQPGQVSVTVRGEAAHVELVRLSGYTGNGIRVCVGSLAFTRPVIDRYWKVLYSQELAAREELEHVA